MVPAFDGYRGWAVLAIVLFHLLASSGLLLRAPGSVPAQLVWGTLPWAISVFFVVSGFVMFLPTVAGEGRFGSASTFAIRRAARLFPALWLALLISLALLAFLPSSSIPLPGIGEIAINFTGMMGWMTLFDPGQASGFGVDTPVWTLTLEVGFYLVLPFVAATYFRRPLIGLAVAAAIAVLWRELFANLIEIASFLDLPLSPQRAVQLQFADNQLPHWAFSFAAGMTSAWAYVRLREIHDQRTLERAAPIVAAVAMLPLGFFVYLAGGYSVDHPAAAVVHFQWQSWELVIGYTAALATVMLALALAPPRLQVPLSHPLVRQLADISYGVYLIHAVIIWVIVLEFSPPQDGSLTTFAILSAVVVPVSFAYGYLSARFLEQPIRRWAHRFARGERDRRTGGPAPAGSAAPGARSKPGPAAPRP